MFSKSYAPRLFKNMISLPLYSLLWLPLVLAANGTQGWRFREEMERQGLWELLPGPVPRTHSCILWGPSWPHRPTPPAAWRLLQISLAHSHGQRAWVWEVPWWDLQGPSA